MKRAIVTGALGQDASFLIEYLLSLNYSVIGVYRRVSSGNEFQNLKDAYGHENLNLIEGDICEAGFINYLFKETKAHEIYGLAAQSHVGHSFAIPATTFRTNAEAVITQLEAIRQFSPESRFYNAATSEMFGGIDCPHEGFDEKAPLNPRSPYAIAKVAAFHTTKNYRESYGLHVSSGILFNHSSIRRGYDFATRKITRGIANIVAGHETKISMGHLGAFRDEGHSKDFIKAMHLIVQQDSPDDYVVATGTGATIKEMLEYVCSLANLDINSVYQADERFMRPSDVPFLKGNPEKIKRLGWTPNYTWKDLLQEMYEFDLGIANL
jgi:GDPmannose 4,6-dehydratase